MLSNFAAVMELVDMPDLGSGAARRGGSSPFIRTDKKQADACFFLFKYDFSNQINKCIFATLLKTINIYENYTKQNQRLNGHLNC